MNKTFEFILQYYLKAKITKMLSLMAISVLIITAILINSGYYTIPFLEEWKIALNACLIILGIICFVTCFSNHQREKQLFLFLYTLFLPIKQKLTSQFERPDIWTVINRCKDSPSSIPKEKSDIQDAILKNLQNYSLIKCSADGVPNQIQYQLLYKLLEQNIPPSGLPAISGSIDGDRQFERYKTNEPSMVLIKNKNGDVIQGSIIDISRGGVCVHCETPVNLDEVLLLEIYCTKNYYFFHTDHLLFTCMGTVVRSWEDQSSGFAIIFDDIIDFSLFTKKLILTTPYLIK